MTFTPMGKDIATFQIHCLLQELYHLNDAVINGDLTDKAAQHQAQTWADELKPHLLKLDGMKEAWLCASISFGGVINLSWQLDWQDGDKQIGNTTPVRKG